MYALKEIFYTLQGEGHHTGSPAIFLRFAGCTLWSGHEKHSLTAVCTFCDTDFVGVDGEGHEQQPDSAQSHVIAPEETEHVEDQEDDEHGHEEPAGANEPQSANHEDAQGDAGPGFAVTASDGVGAGSEGS